MLRLLYSWCNFKTNTYW